jgi:stage V sporulation protein B
LTNQIKNYFGLMRQENEMVRDSFTLTFYNFLMAVLTFVSNVTIAYFFGPENFGVYRVLVIIFGVTIPYLFDFGGTLTLTKYIAELKVKDKGKIGHLSRQFLLFRLATFAVLTLLILAFKEQIVLFFLHDLSYVNLIYPSLVIFITTYFLILNFAVLGYENFRLYGITNTIGRLIYVVAVIWVAYSTGSIYYSLIIYGLAFFIGYILNVPYLLKQGFLDVKERFNTTKVFLKYSLPMHVFYSTNYLALSSVVLLSPFFSAKAIGYFSWAFQFYWVSTFIAVSIASMLLPKVSKMSGKSQETKGILGKIMFLYTPVAVIGVIGTLLFSNLFVSIVGPQYMPGLLVFKVVMVYGFIAGFGLIYISYLTAKSDTKRVAVLQLLVNGILLLLGFLSLKLI